MKMKRLMMILLIATIALMAMGESAFAESYTFKGNCKYDGKNIVSSFTSKDWAAKQSSLEPGDSLDYVITYINRSKKTTNWYMRNEVLKTLEESKSVAENGGYTYVLKNIGPNNKETVLFDNSEVGGEAKRANLEGLKQATNATKEYFFIQQLKPGKQGKTVLHVVFEGETEANDYMDTEGSLMVSYAVEEEGAGAKAAGDNANGVKTGDNTKLWLYVAIMVIALIIGAFAVASYRKDRKDGDEA